VPALLAGLLASGILFLEASPATATEPPGVPTLVRVFDQAGDTLVEITPGTGTVDRFEATVDGGNTWTVLVADQSNWLFPSFNRTAQRAVQVRAVNEAGVSASSSAFTFPQFMLNNGLFRVGGDGHDSTTVTRVASIGTNSQIKQPFYFDGVIGRWAKMTYGSAAFDFAVGFGTGNEPAPETPYDATKNWTGSTVYGTFQSPNPFGSPIAGSAVVRVEDFVCDFQDLSPVCMGTGTIVASADFLLGGRTVKVINRYTLAPESKFLEVTTSVENLDNSDLENVNVWVGTLDDWAGINNSGGDGAQVAFENRYRADLPQKFRGTITNGIFQTIASSTTDRASALVLESLDGAGLFFSTSPNVNVTVAPCCETLQALALASSATLQSHTARGFQNAVTLNPNVSAISTPRGAEDFKPGNVNAEFFQNRRTDLRDAGYALHLPIGPVPSGEVKGATWFLGGTAYSERGSLLTTVSEAAVALDRRAEPVSLPSSSARAQIVTPEVKVNPRIIRQPTFRKATGDTPARLLGKSLKKDVFFAADSSRLGPEARKSLRQAARLAIASRSRIAITGFAAESSRGSAYEKSVAQRRALAVARFLRSRGVDTDILLSGLNSRQGSQFPGQPRRVEIRVLK
jgi:outer membrane protein OmpA-like peptidoglycan-associated protein